MKRWSERAGPALGATALGALVAGALALGARVAAAQTAPGQAPPGQSPAARGTARADSLHRPVTDSTSRDSIVAGQLRAVARRPRRSLVDRLNVDRLRLTDIGFAGGLAFPDQVRSTQVYALHADYGEVVPGFRVVVGVTYWSSRYTDDAVADFARALGRVAGRGRGDVVAVGRVRSSDVALNAETRWRPNFLGGRGSTGRLRPWTALGAGLHFINVQNPAIDGTFIARTLDGVAFGPTAAVGFDLAALRAIQLSAEARYDLFNGARYGSLRAGASYVFDRRRGP